jgi:hypothetical protein
VPLTKTTIRALAASVAFVAAGATFAAAAVYHLPVLGFSSASVASAAPSAASQRRAVPRQVAPRKIVRIRYVDVVVHRPAPPAANATAPAIAPTYPVASRTLGAATPQPLTYALTYAPRAPSARTFHEGAEHDSEPGDHAPTNGGDA